MTTTHDTVREHYGKVARSESDGCCAPGCCAPGQSTPTTAAKQLGYSDEDLARAPGSANLGLGCGNPQAIAALKKGDTVLDLGSGGGFDCFVAASAVGPSGRVIGVDMTPDMVSLARKNAAASDVTNVEFRLGEIEHLPVADEAVDVIMSNCVINLSPDKATVFGEAFRVLRAGGRLAIADVVARRELPAAVKADADRVAGCVGGAATVAEVDGMMKRAGFVDVVVDVIAGSDDIIEGWSEDDLSQWIASARIEARKP